MIADKKRFFTGLGLMVAFIVVLVILFSPVLDGKNALEYSDELYNSISKGSAYYIPAVREESNKFIGVSIDVTLSMTGLIQADEIARLFTAGGAETKFLGSNLHVRGDLGAIIENCLIDADAMYNNNGDIVSVKYGYDARQATYNWWYALKEMNKKLSKQKKFKEAKLASLVAKKAVETSYNYYQIEPQKITDKIAIVIFSLIFYVIYTIWYGFAILFMFEGWGLKFGH